MSAERKPRELSRKERFELLHDDYSQAWAQFMKADSGAERRRLLKLMSRIVHQLDSLAVDACYEILAIKEKVKCSLPVEL